MGERGRLENHALRQAASSAQGQLRNFRLQEWTKLLEGIAFEQIAEAINEQRMFLRQVIDIDPNLIFAKDRQGRLTLVNQAVADVFGTTVQDLIGKTDADFNADTQEVAFFRRVDLEVMDTLQERFISEEHVTDAQGRIRWLQTVKRPIIGADGKATQVLGSSTDITQRKLAERKLRESEERLGRTETFSLVMATHVDLQGRWLKVPPTLCELLGYTEAELLGHRFHEVTHPADIDLDWNQCLRLIRGEIKSVDLEKRYVRKNGSLVWVYINCSVVADEKDKPVHFLTYIRDITNRKLNEEKLREYQESLRQLANELNTTEDPGLNGIEVTRKIRSQMAETKVIALSMHADRRFVMGVLAAGANGDLLKDSAFEELVIAVTAVTKGKMYLSHAIAETVIKSSLEKLDRGKQGSIVLLSGREREVLQMIAEGRSTKEIALKLFVSTKTVETHRKQIMDKLNIHTIAGLTNAPDGKA